MKLTHVLSATAALVSLLAIGRNASAQDALPQDAPPPPPVAYTQPAPPPGAVVVVGVQGQPPPGYGYVESPEYRDHARFRFGIEIGGGYMFAASSLGAARGGAWNAFGLRLGVQINNPWAVYLQSSLPIGFAGGLTRDGDVLGGAAIASTNAIMAEYTLGDILHLGLGPSFDGVIGGICTELENGTTTQPSDKPSCIGTAGAAFGITGRIAATFGVARPSRRKAFSVGLDLHPSFTPAGAFFFTTLSLGYEAY